MRDETWRRQSVAYIGFVLLVGLMAMGCDRFAAERRRWERTRYIETDSMGAQLRDIVAVPSQAPRDLIENSAAAMSVRQPSVMFTINDSGNDPVLFALDTTGADRGAWRIANARNVDWESLAVGPCAAGGPRGCLYIGDTGDNDARYPLRTIYRVREPDATGGRATLTAQKLEYVYSNGPRDVEAMVVARNGDVVLISKRPLTNSAAILRPALVYVIPASAWTSGARATAMLVDSLPIVPGSALLRVITDAALSPNGRYLAVRTYAQVYLFRADSLTGRVDHSVRPSVCNLVALDEEGGEGVGWVNDSGRLVFTSEGKGAPLRFGTCRLP